MSVFQLLQMACLELAKIAARRGPTAQPKIYPRFVFCRMMWGELWTTLCLARELSASCDSLCMVYKGLMYPCSVTSTEALFREEDNHQEYFQYVERVPHQGKCCPSTTVSS